MTTEEKYNKLKDLFAKRKAEGNPISFMEFMIGGKPVPKIDWKAEAKKYPACFVNKG